jgi:hypothetical protein
MIKLNPHYVGWIVRDISVQNFKAILDFIYFDQEPSYIVNLRELFVASINLKIPSLSQTVAGKIVKGINARNALEILLMGDKFNFPFLKFEAFKEIEKYLPKNN